MSRLRVKRRNAKIEAEAIEAVSVEAEAVEVEVVETETADHKKKKDKLTIKDDEKEVDITPEN